MPHAVVEAANSLTSQSAAAVSSSLGVGVEATSPAQVATGIAASIVRATATVSLAAAATTRSAVRFESSVCNRQQWRHGGRGDWRRRRRRGVSHRVGTSRALEAVVSQTAPERRDQGRPLLGRRRVEAEEYSQGKRRPQQNAGAIGKRLLFCRSIGSSAQERLTKAAALLKTWEIDAADVTLEEEIGDGGQAVVMRGQWKGMEVAAKQPRRRGSVRGSAAAAVQMETFIRREVRALSRVRHPNVVKLYGSCLSPTPMVLMAYAPHGTLQDAVDDLRFQTNEDVVRLLAGIARGMEAVHAHNIIHLDLKPENVLIGPLDTPWVTDFGLSTSSNQNSMSVSSVGGRGTMAFKAPDLFANPPVVLPAALVPLCRPLVDC